MKFIEKMLKAQIAPFSHIGVKNGELYTLNTSSYYAQDLTENDLFFDVGNQKSLANFRPNGSIECLTFYQGNWRTEEKPGVWVNKGIRQTKDITFSLNVNGKVYLLAKADHDRDIDVVNDVMTRIQHYYHELSVTELPFCPILEDNTRLSMCIVPFFVKNISANVLHVALNEPPLFRSKYSDQQNINIILKKSILTLQPGESGVLSLALVDPSCTNDLILFKQNDDIVWLKQTYMYYSNFFTNLKMKQTELTHMVRRAAYQSLLSLAMDASGKIVGSNWGSFPATSRIWNKDMYYACLPTVWMDKELCQKSILWFDTFGVKQVGSKFHGGVTHSIGNTLSAALLSGLYFQYNDDLNFFRVHSELVDHMVSLVRLILSKRPNQDYALCHSDWVSDAYALGDFHTGSNICLWSAINGLLPILTSLGRYSEVEYFQTISKNIKNEIDNFLTVSGKFGKQWLEGRNIHGDYHASSTLQYEKPIQDQGLIFLNYMIHNHQIDLMMHDGEESDTTLAPIYNFVKLDNSVYRAAMKFTGSVHNPTYVSKIDGISWGEESGATFPGFISIMMGHSDDGQLNAQLNKLVNLTDLDGSWWWWPYPLNPSRKKVVRNLGCGKCGWASGMFISLMITQLLGVSRENNMISVHPTIDGFSWENIPMGSDRISLTVTPSSIEVANVGVQNITLFCQGQKKKLAVGKVISYERKINNGIIK